MARQIAHGVACLAALLQITRPAAAEASPAALETKPAPAETKPSETKVTFSLELSAVGCPTTDTQLAAAILVRVPSAERVESGADVAIYAEIFDGGNSSLSVALKQGSSRREFQGASCDEAAALIAFISSLVLDARPEERLQATELAVVPAPAREPPPSAEPTPRAAKPMAPAAAATTDRPETARHQSKAELALSAALAFETAVATTPPAGGLFGVYLRWPRPTFFAPELRAELLATVSATQQANPAYVGKVHLGLTTGRLSVCPVRLVAAQGALRLGACATFDLGSLHARGDPSIEGNARSMLWLAGGLAFLAEVPLSEAFELELLAGVKALVRRGSFFLEADPAGAGPARPVYDVPPASAGFALGLGFRP